MNKKIYQLMLAGLVAPACSVYAQSDSSIQSLVVNHANSATKTVTSLDNILSIKFDAEGLLINKIDGEQDKVLFSDITSIKFEDATTGIMVPTIKQEHLTLEARGGQIFVGGWDSSKQTNVNIYNTNGTKQAAISQWNGSPISVESLPKGIYILQIGKQSIKFSK